MTREFFANDKNGFTLIEIIVVLGVISILSAAFFPRLTGVIDKAKVANVKEEYRNLRNSMNIIYMGGKEYPDNIDRIKELDNGGL